MSVVPVNAPVTYARSGSYYLADFDRLMAPLIAAWVRSAQELFWLAPSTVVPLTAAKVVAWPGAEGSPRLFRRDAMVEPLGYCELNPMPGQQGHYWLGHCLIRPDQRGTGLGRIMIDLLLDEAFRRSAYRVSLMVFPENLGAYRCYLSAGMREAGDQFKHFPTSNKRHRMVQMTISRDRYLTLRRERHPVRSARFGA